MNTYNIPRNYKGEGRFLYIFSTKAIITLTIGLVVGLPFYFIFRIIGLSVVGVVIILIFALIGYIIGTFKVPNSSAFEFTKKTGGESIEDIIIRWVKFKKKKNRIYIFKKMEEVTKDE